MRRVVTLDWNAELCPLPQAPNNEFQFSAVGDGDATIYFFVNPLDGRVTLLRSVLDTGVSGYQVSLFCPVGLCLLELWLCWAVSAGALTVLGCVCWSSDCVGLCRLELWLCWALSAGSPTVLPAPLERRWSYLIFFFFSIFFSICLPCLRHSVFHFEIVHTVQKSVTNKSISNLLHPRIKINK